RHRPCALGLSFGGGAVLELARSGAPLDRVVSIYGYLDTQIPAARGDIHASLHIIHLKNDPVVPSEHAAAFSAEMQHANTPFRMKRLNGPAHGFMNPDDPAYDGGASEQVWSMIERVLDG
uniref:dienelactone hydrolase family protein n=1 Tax=Salidesulfovibrio brasiliensis TaxID=221711 RepID=UPI000A684BC3